MAAAAGAQADVVLLHGLWMPGWVLVPLARRLVEAGYRTHVFTYSGRRQSPVENARALARFIAGLDAGSPHFVAHSLGGLVVRHLLASTGAPARPGRVVTLGTAQQRSRRAALLMQHPIGRLILGRSWHDGLSGALPEWNRHWALGCVAGTRAFGVARLLGSLPEPSDGVVTVAETRLAAAADHIALPVSHSGMLLSAAVGAQTVHFLARGCFAHGRSSS